MRLKLAVISLFLLPAAVGSLSAQSGKFDPQKSFWEITAGGGVTVPVTGSADNSAVAFVDGAWFWNDSFGLRSGVRYTYENNGAIHQGEVLVHLVWRSRIRSSKRWRKLPEVMLPSSYETYTPWQGQRVNTGSAAFGSGLLSALLFVVPERVEFGAGAAPGYIFGGDWAAGKSVWTNGEWEHSDYSVHKKFGFTATAEVSMRITYRIWRFELQLIPSMHYNLLDNFDVKPAGAPYKPTRLCASFCGALGFMF